MYTKTAKALYKIAKLAFEKVDEAIWQILTKFTEVVQQLVETLKNGVIKMIKQFLSDPKRAKVAAYAEKAHKAYGKLREKSEKVTEIASFVSDVAGAAQYALKHGRDARELIVSPDGVSDAPDQGVTWSPGKTKHERARAK